MRISHWLAMGALALVLIGTGVAFLLPAMARPSIPQPESYRELDPDVATLLRSAVSDVQSEPSDIKRWVHLGMCYEANDLPVLAQQCSLAVTKIDAHDSRGWYGLALSRAALSDFGGAERAMQHAINLEPDYGPAYWRLGTWLFEEGKLDEAGQAFQSATHHDSADQAGWFGLARTQLARGDVQNAVTTLEWLAKSPPPNGPYAWQLLAGAYRQLDRADDALTARLRGHGAAPQFRDPWQIEVDQLQRGFGAQLTQAKSLLAYGRADDSIALLKKLQQRQPDDPMVLNNLATVFRAVGKFDESNSALEQALALQPSFVHAYFGLALNAWTHGQHADSALTNLDKALALNASYAPAYALRGDILAATGNHNEAADAYAQAYLLQPQQVAWLQQAAHQRLELEQWNRAAELFDTVTRQAPNMADAWSDYSIALAQLDRPDEARAALEQSMKIAPHAERARSANHILRQHVAPEAMGP